MDLNGVSMERTHLLYLKAAMMLVLELLMVPIAIVVGVFLGAISGVVHVGVFALLRNAFKHGRSE